MAEFVPLALACGHLIQGVAHFDAVPGEPTKVECPEGCGWQQFVVEPDTYTGEGGRVIPT